MPILTCRCGACRIEAWGPPIDSVECHCTSCRAAAARIEALPGAVTERTRHGGVPCVMHRKDRVRLVWGEPLAAFRLSPGAKTVRTLATCCNSLMFTEFKGGHWLSIHAARWPEADRPPAQLRTMTADDPSAPTLPDDIPNARAHTAGFMWRLLRAWVAMGLRAPKLGYPTREVSLA